MRLPLRSEDGRLPAPVGNHHLPAGDVSLPTTPAHRAARGQYFHKSAKICAGIQWFISSHKGTTAHKIE